MGAKLKSVVPTLQYTLDVADVGGGLALNSGEPVPLRYTEDLRHYFTFSQSNLEDLSSYNSPILSSSGVTLGASGRFGPAALFSSGHIDLEPPDFLTSSYSIHMVINPSVINPGRNTLLSFTDSAYSEALAVYFDGSGNLVVDHDGTTQSFSSVITGTGSFYSISFSWDGSNLSFYLDGSLQASPAFTAAFPLAINFTVGARRTGVSSYDSHFEGVIDSYIWWKQDILASEISSFNSWESQTSNFDAAIVNAPMVAVSSDITKYSPAEEGLTFVASNSDEIVVSISGLNPRASADWSIASILEFVSSGNDGVIAAWGQGSNNGVRIQKGTGSVGEEDRLALIAGDGVSETVVDTGVDLTDGEVVAVVGTYDQSTKELRLLAVGSTSGPFDISTTLASDPVFLDQELYIGSDGSTYYDGDIYDCQIFNSFVLNDGHFAEYADNIVRPLTTSFTSLIDIIEVGYEANPPPGEAVPPFLDNLVPDDLDTGVAVTATVTGDIVDVGDGVDGTTIRITIGGTVAYEAQALQNGFTGTVTDNGNGSFSYSLTAPSNFPDLSTVVVRVECSDLSPIVNTLDQSYSFQTTDATGPFLTNQNPAPGASSILQSSNVTFRITDLGSQVTQPTINVQITQAGGPTVDAVVNGAIVAPFDGGSSSINPVGFGFDYVLDPTSNLVEGGTVLIEVQAEDAFGNTLSTSYSFTTADNTAPSIINQSPAPSSNALPSTIISFDIVDAGSGIDLATLDVTIDEGGGPQVAVLGGVIQAPYNALGSGISGTTAQYSIALKKAVDLPDNQNITIDVDVDDVAGNNFTTSYSFLSIIPDNDFPFVTNEIPVRGQTGVSLTQPILFSIEDSIRGVDLTTVNVTITLNGVPEQIITNGSVTGVTLSTSISPSVTGLGFDVVVNPPAGGWGDNASIDVSIDASDLNTPPNVMPTVNYTVQTTVFAPPVVRVAQTELRGVLGSIVQLDGRDSIDPNGNPIFFNWYFRSVPIGSILQSDLDIQNPASIVEIRPDRRAISFIPDVLGQYVVELEVTNAGSSSTQQIVVNIGLSLVPCGEGVIPDMQFIWQYMASFYQLLEDREIFQVVWSAMVQILGADFTALYSNDYNKSLETIQPTVMRRWQRFSMRTDLLNTTQSVILGNIASGTLAETGPLVRTSATETRVFRAGDFNFPSLDVNYGIQGKVLEISGQGYTINRAYNVTDQASSFTSVLLNDGSFNNVTSDLDDSSTSTAFWVNQNDYVYFGNTTKFSAITLALQSGASGDLNFVFEYSDGAGGWTTFLPTTDGTNGGQQSGEATLGVPAIWDRQDVNGLTFYWVRVQRTAAAVTGPQARTALNRVSDSVIVTQETAIPNNLTNVSYRIGHLLHTPTIDLEAAGVSAGDVLVLEVKRKDTGQTAELQAQILAVDGNRAGFEISLEDLDEGALGLDLELFEQMVQDIRVITPDSADLEITATAQAFVDFVPTGINVASQPFSTYLFTIRAKEVRHNSRIAVDEDYVSIPGLQYEINENPTILVENRDYILSNGFLIFQPNVYTLKDHSPSELWSECTHVDNSEAVENNFGRLVGLTRTDLEARATRAPYLSAIKGLWYALTNGPSVSNLRLALHILMGLPFTEQRGEVIAIETNYGTDVNGTPIGRLLIEDVDDKDQRLGVRRFYFFPTVIGLEINPATGETIAVGDIVDAFIPLSKGVTVQDIYTNPTWWLRNLKGLEIRKYFLFQAEIDTDSGVFDIDDLRFSIEFLRTIKPAYSDIIASVVQTLTDDDILGSFTEELTESSFIFRFYDNIGQLGGHESTIKFDDWNHQGVVLQRAGSRPFQTISDGVIRDLVTSQPASDLVVDSATGFGGARARDPGDATHPAVEGDFLVLWPNQPGAPISASALFEFTALVNQNQGTLGNVPSLNDPTTFALNPPSLTGFGFGSNLVGSVIRRSGNPVTQASDGDLASGGDELNSAGSDFIADGVQIGDIVVIETGANAGAYLVDTTVAQVTPRDYTSSGVPQIDSNTLKLVNMDGSVVTATAQSTIEFRVVRPHHRRKHWHKARVVNEAGTMKVEVLDFGQPTEVPFDVFTPADVGLTLGISNAENPANNGIWTIDAYEHAGKVAVTRTGGPNTSDAGAQAVLNIDINQSWERADELSPVEYLTTTVT